MNRRTLLKTALVGLSALTISPELQAQVAAAGGWAIKPLPFDPKKLKGISEKLIVSHHDNNYAGATRRLGQIQQMLQGLPNNAPGFQVKGLKMEELIATNSAILHEEYFGNLGGDGKASGNAQQAGSADFGGFDKLEQSFRGISTALRGGGGWGLFDLNPLARQISHQTFFPPTPTTA